MSERGRGRGGGGGDRGSSNRGAARGGRGGGNNERGGRGGGNAGADGKSADRPERKNILDLSKYMDKEINVKFNGGREIVGTLKGFDQLTNLVLDGVKEITRGNLMSFASIQAPILT